MRNTAYFHHMPKTLTPIRITLREARKNEGLTQADLAELADVRQATISDIEKGKTTRIDLPLLEKLCRVLKVTPGDMLLLEDEPPKAKGKKRR